MAGHWNDERPLPQPPQEPEASVLNLFDSIGAGLAAVVLDAKVAVEAHGKSVWAIARPTLPIPEAKEHGTAAAASSMLYVSKGVSENPSDATLLSSRTTVADAVARLDSNKVSRFDQCPRDLKWRAPTNSTLIDTACWQSAQTQTMRNSRLAATDGSINTLKVQDLCDTATRSKIDRWMSQAAVPFANLTSQAAACPAHVAPVADQWFSVTLAPAAETSRPFTTWC